MGLSASKRRVSKTLEECQEFQTACETEFEYCLSETQHGFQGVFPYQLFPASQRLHLALALSPAVPLISRWVPSHPTRAQLDRAYRAHHQNQKDQEEALLGLEQFEEVFLELFAATVVENAGRSVARRLPVGVAAIAGIGWVTQCGKEVVGPLIAVYAIGVAASTYLGLTG